MQFKSNHILLGFSTFLFAYSLNNTIDLWYAILLGSAVLVYYTFPRASLIMWVYLFFGLCLVLTFTWTASNVLVFPLLMAIILTTTYPWFREIPWAKTPIIASSLTPFLFSPMSSSAALVCVALGYIRYYLFNSWINFVFPAKLAIRSYFFWCFFFLCFAKKLEDTKDF